MAVERSEPVPDWASDPHRIVQWSYPVAEASSCAACGELLCSHFDHEHFGGGGSTLGDSDGDDGA